jgi:pimeloyl-ACP methyl ester carboxylesterase
MSAIPMPAASNGGSPATIVLVHGAWADGSSWNAVIPQLSREGYTVRVPPNLLRNLSNDAANIAAFLSTLSGPIILVGHSYGGAVITNAANGNSDIEALVYVDAFVPDEGESVFPLAGADSAAAADPSTIFDIVPYPGAPDGDVDLYLKKSLFVPTFASGVDSETAELLYPSQRPLSLSAGNAPSGPPAWRTIPSWCVLGTSDKIIVPAQQRMMAERAKSTITPVDAGHLSMVSHPDVVTDVIRQAASQSL